MARYVVAREDEIPPNSRKLVIVKGRPIAIFNINGEHFGILNRCPHQGGSLCDGRLVGLIESTTPGEYTFSRAGEILRCPWHGWEFDLRTGRSMCRPTEVSVRKYDVTIADSVENAEVPTVETFEVGVEGKYVVINI